MANVHRYIAPGETIDFLNDTGSAIAAGTSIKKNSLPMVVQRDVANGAYGSAIVPGNPIFEGPLDTSAAVNYAIGEVVYMNTVTGYVVKTDPAGNGFKLGVAVPGVRGVISGINSASACAAANGPAVRYMLTP